MRKSMLLRMAALCCAVTLFSVTDTANAAPKATEHGQRSVANWYWSEEDEVWPPVAGRY